MPIIRDQQQAYPKATATAQKQSISISLHHSFNAKTAVFHNNPISFSIVSRETYFKVFRLTP